MAPKKAPKKLRHGKKMSQVRPLEFVVNKLQDKSSPN
jgi:hypothetical protein